MSADADAVLAAAERRASALASGDGVTLAALLHRDFVWTSHRGAMFDRDAYLAANVGGPTEWHGQALQDAVVRVAGDVAVLTFVARDEVTTAAGREVFEMPVTQTWVRVDEGWRCLAGHAGPRRT